MGDDQRPRSRGEASISRGTFIGPYRLEREIGRGGMGVVYLAHDSRLDRLVALKSLPPALRSDPEAALRLEREAKALASLSHPNVATIHGIEDFDSSRFLVLEYVEGDSLEERLKSGPIATAEAVAICAQVAAGLEAAHERDLVHRDLKPGNVLFSSSKIAKVLDFGLVGHIESADPESGTVPFVEPLTAQGAVAGTPGYMSPEQLRGEALNEACDVWAFGCLLYECLTGKPAFDGNTHSDRIAATLKEDPDWQALPPEATNRIRDLLTRCICRDVCRRPSAASIRSSLELWLADRGDRRPHGRPEWRHAVLHNLPRNLTSFIGRERELAEVLALLDINRLLTLTGPGGCGKSRLALEIGARLLAQYREGVWVAELATVNDPSRVASTVVSALGVREQASRDLTQVLVDALEDRELVLVVDNCEHLLGASADVIARLLQSCASLRVLATSREPLGVAGEQVYSVPPLTLPDVQRAYDAVSLENTEAVRLFVDRARLAKPSFILNERNALAIAQTCRRLDGIPLAIELAASRVRVLSVEQIAARLEDRFHILKAGSHVVTPHHRTLRAAVDWSYDLLSESEQLLFRRLAVFAGDCSLDASESICADSMLETSEVLDLLSSLVDKSLVSAVELDGEVGYRMLETVREYARELLLESGERTALRAAHVAYYLAFSEKAGPTLEGAAGAWWSVRLSRYHDNCLKAFDAASASEKQRFCAALGPFWTISGQWTLGRKRLDAALESSSVRGFEDRRAWASRHAAVLARLQGDEVAAEALAQASLEAFRGLSNSRGMTRAKLVLGDVALVKGKFDLAVQYYAEALESARAARDEIARGMAICSLGHVDYFTDDLARARSRGLEAFEIAGDLGVVRVQDHASMLVAKVDWRNGREASSLDRATRVLASRREANDVDGVINALKLLCLFLSSKDPGAVQTFAEELLRVSRRTGAKHGESTAYQSLAQSAVSRDDLETAHKWGDQAEALSRKHRRPMELAACLWTQAIIALKTRAPHLARTALDECMDLLKRTERRFASVLCLRGYAALAAQEGEVQKAALLLGASETLSTAYSVPCDGVEQELRQSTRESLRAVMDPGKFEMEVAHGRELTLDQAIALVRP